MSSYVVDDRTINRILSGLTVLAPYVNRTLHGVTGYDLDGGTKALQAIGTQMRKLNEEATFARYSSNHPEEMMPKTPFRYQQVVCSSYQALKSLRCWLYQCNEGDYDQHPLFRAFKEIAGDLAMEIVMKLPQYEKADWE